MTITFENDNDVIVYALEKVISHARNTQQIFVAQCIWWLASIIGLEKELISYIDNLPQRENVGSLQDYSGNVHPDRAQQILSEKAVSPLPRDLAEDRRLDQIMKTAENCVEESERARNTWQRSRVNLLPQTRLQLRKARKIKRLQETGKKQEAEQNQRLQEIRATVIQNHCKE
jgi:hypothetical protein